MIRVFESRDMRRVGAELWLDPAFNAFPPMRANPQWLYLFLLTNPEGYVLPGLLQQSIARIATALQWREASVVKNADCLQRKGLIRVDWDNALVWIPRGAKDNLPRRHRDLSGWPDAWARLPSCPMKGEIGCALLAIMAKRYPKLAQSFAAMVAGTKSPAPAPAGLPDGVLPAAAPRERRAAKGVEMSPEWQALWANYPRRGGSNNQREAFEKYTARLKDGYSHAEMADGVQRYRRLQERIGKIGTEFVLQGTTFFGPKLHFKEEFPLPVTPKTQLSPTTSPDFERVAQAYPNKVNQPEAWSIWQGFEPPADTALTEAILAGIERWKKIDQWRKEGGAFVPKLASFLRQRNWLAPTLAAPVGVDVAAIDAEIAKMNGHAPGAETAPTYQDGNTFEGVATVVVTESRAVTRAADVHDEDGAGHYGRSQRASSVLTGDPTPAVARSL